MSDAALKRDIVKLAKDVKWMEKKLKKEQDHSHKQRNSVAEPSSPALQARSVNTQGDAPRAVYAKEEARNACPAPPRSDAKQHPGVSDRVRHAASTRHAHASSASLAPPTRRENSTVQMKVLVVGDTKCGKTSIIQRFAYDKFAEEYETTVGADYAKSTHQWDQNTTLRLQLWDIAGQDRYADITRPFFRNAVGAIVVCDVTRPLTTNSVAAWKKVLDEKVRLPSGGNIPVVLIANKTDLLQSGTESFETGARIERTSSENKFVDWFTASAKEDTNVQEAVHSLIEKMIDNHKARQIAVERGEQQATVTRDNLAKIKLREDDGVCRVGPRTGKCC